MKQIVFLMGMVVLLAACATPAPTPTPLSSTEGFAIYLTARNLSAEEILRADLGTTWLQGRPIIATEDIVRYSQDTHEIELTPAAYERLKALEVPTSGVPFVVCVDRHPIYGGAFWASFSSASFPGVVIDTIYAEQHHPIRLQLGYPESLELFAGPDRRSDPRIMQALERAGRLGDVSQVP